MTTEKIRKQFDFCEQNIFQSFISLEENILLKITEIASLDSFYK
jgi:hypothetical protein